MDMQQAQGEGVQFQCLPIVRDMPVDWTLLLSNILDPDHGLFAHQNKAFDMYSASTSVPIQVQEEFPNGGKGWTLTTAVDAVDKVTVVDRLRRGMHMDMDTSPARSTSTSTSDSKQESTVSATSVFHAPNHVMLCRRDKETGRTGFMTAFWICPVGTGRSRFMAAAIMKKTPVPVPAWVANAGVNNFIDQDTYLLATQQQYVLKAEVKAIKIMMDESGELGAMKARKKLFVYRSPTERAGSRVEAFWDATVTRVPNRVETLLTLDRSGAFNRDPSRRSVLDREKQYLRICPDAQDVVRRCDRVIRGSKLAAAAAVFCKVWVASMLPESALARRYNTLLNPVLVGGTLLLSLLATIVARAIRRQFFYKFDEDRHRRDVAKIPITAWKDP
jgi:hypothetical protein